MLTFLPPSERGRPCLSGVPRQVEETVEFAVSTLCLRERAIGSTASTFVLAAQRSRESLYIENMVTAVSSLELR